STGSCALFEDRRSTAACRQHRGDECRDIWLAGIQTREVTGGLAHIPRTISLGDSLTRISHTAADPLATSPRPGQGPVRCAGYPSPPSLLAHRHLASRFTLRARYMLLCHDNLVARPTGFRPLWWWRRGESRA